MPVRQAEGNAGDIFPRLLLNAGERVAFRLGLDGADGLAIHKERAVGLAFLEGEFLDRDAALSSEIDGILRLDRLRSDFARICVSIE